MVFQVFFFGYHVVFWRENSEEIEKDGKFIEMVCTF